MRRSMSSRPPRTARSIYLPQSQWRAMRGRERGRRSVGELRFLQGFRRISPRQPLDPERGRLSAWRLPGALRFSQRRPRRRPSLLRNPLPWRGSLGDFQGEVVWNWGPTEGTGSGPSLYEPRPAYQSWSRTSSEARGALPTSRPSPTHLPGCGSTTRTFRVGSSSMGPAFPLRYGRASSTRRVGSTTPRQQSSPKSTQVHPYSANLAEGSRTTPPVRAASDPTSRASWPPKAGNFGPGWAARSVGKSEPDQKPRSTRNG